MVIVITGTVAMPGNLYFATEKSKTSALVPCPNGGIGYDQNFTLSNPTYLMEGSMYKSN